MIGFCDDDDDENDYCYYYYYYYYYRDDTVLNYLKLHSLIVRRRHLDILIETVGLPVLNRNFRDFRLDDVDLNLLKPNGHVMHQQFNIQQLYALPTLYLCVLYLSENKQRLVPLTA